MNLFDKILKIFLTKKVLGSIIVIAVTFVITRIFTNIIHKVLIKGKSNFEAKKRASIVNLLKSIFNTIIWLLAILIILDFYGVDTRSLVASLGIAGVILGLALQDTVKDFISGVTLILENYLQVGDIVTYKDFTGEVIDFGLRTTKIKGFNGEVLIIANRNVDSIINASQKSTHLYLGIATAYEEKTEQVEKILNKVISEAIDEKLIMKDSAYLGINDLGAHSVEYLIDIHCDQNNRYPIKRKVLRKIKLAYEKAGIKIPYNQIEVHHGKDL